MFIDRSWIQSIVFVNGLFSFTVVLQNDGVKMDVPATAATIENEDSHNVIALHLRITAPEQASLLVTGIYSYSSWLCFMRKSNLCRVNACWWLYPTDFPLNRLQVILISDLAKVLHNIYQLFKSLSDRYHLLGSDNDVRM